MHGSVRKGLEHLLSAEADGTASAAASHVSGCRQCASEIDVMRAQSQMFKTLKSPDTFEPGPGFYARVMQRIEEHAKRSIWWVFVYSPVGKRLAYASLALTLALGSYVVAAETRDGHLGGRTVVAQSNQPEHYDAPVMGNADEQRAAVLANFVSHPAPSQ